MFTRIKKNILTLVAVMGLMALPMAFASTAISAQTIEDNIGGSLRCGSNLDARDVGSCEEDVQAGTEGINNIVRDIINIFSIIVGIVSVIMIIYGGFRYVTSGGDSGNVGNAKNTIIYAIIGLVIVALAQFIVQFVLDKVTTA